MAEVYGSLGEASKSNRIYDIGDCVFILRNMAFDEL